ncbi:PBP1A family penicillin-binding protein [Arenibaculum sp.]|uniref:transglycosylase domain-containing protein n=1 Tax=Arenibaculum sp. TaxID=2865862 RepID=UPI002E0EF01C
MSKRKTTDTSSRKPAGKPPPGRRTAARPTSRGRGWGATIAKWMAVAGIWAVILVVGAVAYFAYDLPDISEVEAPSRRPAITMLASDGTTFARYGDLHGTMVNAADLPEHLVNAVIATEDRRFYSHFGVDPIGLARAVYTNWRRGALVQGGSTITQQLAKNLFLTPERTLRRKVQEALLAFWLERTYTKNQILTAYLNRVYLGAGTYGVEAAARTYFGKSAMEVDLREAAILAGLLKAPSRFSPASNPAKAAERANVVLGAMTQAGFLSAAEVEALRSQPPLPRRKPGEDAWRYFADWVAEQVPALIGVDHPDVVVRTTLDIGLQRAAERRTDALLAGPGREVKAGSAAVLTMAPDGAIRVMIGGGDYGESQFNRATQALRQPGSSFKPLVFLAAVEAGLTGGSRIDDGPLRIGTWQPKNFEPGHSGLIPLSDALAFSINTSAVRVLDHAGIERTQGVARRLGIASPVGNDLSVALGTSEVTLLELTGAYAAFANGGRAVIPYGVTEILDRNGRVLYSRAGAELKPAVSRTHLAELNRMMIGAVEYGTGKAARLDRMAAGKTGTTQDHRDAWFVGFTADYVTGVWLGNDDNAPMARVTGGGLPARLWHDVMASAHEGLPPRPIPGLDAPAPAAPLLVSDDRAAPPAGSPALSGIGALIRKLTGNAKVEYTYPTGKDD